MGVGERETITSMQAALFNMWSNIMTGVRILYFYWAFLKYSRHTVNSSFIGIHILLSQPHTRFSLLPYHFNGGPQYPFLWLRVVASHWFPHYQPCHQSWLTKPQPKVQLLSFALQATSA